ncbi:hypothetical protein CesoFtcFv8_003099 [Champsocephalus esox]|uniref:Uncharacterized protein n=1 Tax=Champsocephalus esox TaxID=159716 RepID=A0AAN8HB56_9TELE|nr:hypothetical protein CesoFtcFv8_003099 [Champsocephalus esox]
MGRAESDGMRAKEGGCMDECIEYVAEGGLSSPPCPPRPGPQGCVRTGASWVIKHKNVRIKYLLRLTLHKLPAKHQGCPASCGSTQSPQSNNFVPHHPAHSPVHSPHDLNTICAPRTLHVWFC